MDKFPGQRYLWLPGIRTVGVVDKSEKDPEVALGKFKVERWQLLALKLLSAKNSRAGTAGRCCRYPW